MSFFICCAQDGEIDKRLIELQNVVDEIWRIKIFDFNKHEIFKGFEVLTADDKNIEIEMLIRPNLSNNYVVLVLRACNEK